jgi:signal transduction histidine kinase
MLGILAQAVEACQPAMDLRQQTLTTQLPPGPLTVRGDSVRLTQAFTNLLDNACKYTPEGGAIVLAATQRGQALEVRVSDNGIGVSADALPRIFDLFVQDPQAFALYNGGLGIGLAIVRELVEAHGGTVVGQSAGKDLGSTFVVTLPLAGDASRPSA